MLQPGLKNLSLNWRVSILSEVEGIRRGHRPQPNLAALAVEDVLVRHVQRDRRNYDAVAGPQRERSYLAN